MFSGLLGHLWTVVGGHLTLRACCDQTQLHPMLSDLPGHLWTGVGVHLTLCACCNLTQLHPPLQWALLPRMTEMAQGQTLQLAVAGGHLSVCQWLTQHFGLTAADARAADNAALQRAVFNGHMAICQWLTDHFGLTADDARARNDHILHIALRHADNPATCLWLVERFGLDGRTCRHLVQNSRLAPSEVRALDNAALNFAAKHSEFKMVRWLAERFKLPPQHVAEIYDFAMHSDGCRGRMAVHTWLARFFGL
jgi:hypothetical protein